MFRTNKKKVHHFVHDAYVDAWRTTNQIFAFNLVSKEGFTAKGRNTIGAIGKFYNFSFDVTVVSLLNFTFKDRAISSESGGTYKLMLKLLNFMKDFEYEHKTENFLEDFYWQMETTIAGALRRVRHDELMPICSDPDVFDNLILFYCLQLMRTPKARNAVAGHMVEIEADNTKLDTQQKDEYIKMHLLISSLAMAVDLSSKGCVLRLRHAENGEKFVNCDAPVIIYSQGDRTLKDHKGSIPLGPRLLMEIDAVGLGARVQTHGNITGSEVHRMNLRMIANADMTIYFSSNNQRAKYLSVMLAR